MNKTIAIIGAGKLANCLLPGLIKSGYSEKNIWISNPSLNKLELLASEYAVHITTDNIRAAEQAEIILLAVKPDKLTTVAREISPLLQTNPHTLCISFMAGIPHAVLVSAFKTEAMVRAMPNTPAAICEGMTTAYAPDSIAAQHRTNANALLQRLGQIVWIKDEYQMQLSCALAGSGPAYFFYILESLISAAVDLGLSENLARQMCIQTARGSILLAQKNPKKLNTLREQVTSPGGITEHALGPLIESNLQQTFSKMLNAGSEYARSIEVAAKES